MTRRIRTLLQFLAWGSFLIAAPLIVSYSLGHRVRPTSPRQESVGTFLLRTFPRGATVFINGSEERSVTPTAVSSLPSGTYAVRLEKRGYRVWEKRLPIHGTRITDVRNVRLIPATIDEERIHERVEQFSLSPTERFLGVVEKEKTRKRLRLLRTARLADPGIVVGVPLDTRESVILLWAPDEQRIALTTRVGNAHRFHVIDVETGHASPLVATDEVIGWLPERGHVLVVRSGSTVQYLDVDSNTQTTISRTAIAAATASRGVVIVEDRPAPGSGEKPLTLSLVSPGGTRIETIPAPPLQGQRVSRISVSPFGDVALLSFPNGRLVLWDANERRWRELAEHAENLVWSPDGEKLLWQASEFDAWVVNLREQRTVLPRYVPELVVRLSVPLRTIQWFAGSQHLIFFERDVLTLVEIDGRDGHRREHLVSTNRGDSTAAVVDGGAALFVTVRRDSQPLLLRVFLEIPEDR